MTKFACRYAIIRFVPYRETGEFANVGVVLACPETGYFDYQVETRRYGRITSFFEEIDGNEYISALRLFAGELARVKKQIEQQSVSSFEMLRELFEVVVQPREAIFSFSESRPRLAEDPSELLTHLYEHYAQHSFVTAEYKEKVISRRVRQIVNSLQLDIPFRQETIGDVIASAQFPLVQKSEDGGYLKAIKPFLLDQSEPGKIIHHGGLWVDKMTRLRRRKLLPQDVMFAVAGPDQNSGNRHEAFSEICEDLHRLDIAIAPASDDQQIIRFAAN